ncbi:iron-containing alcohol dehydrogenase [Pseudovibrio sp. Tun.PSC04-5.I4]|uniref:iron-containing alcohol dehydrogenase n=1 Tax=Pseudovibrio sp. Tun.PSC04-5.I4 TaxID=1798213 RepID=UPI00088F0A5A|nr:iron-containing alcohol dehydrogenase [Pseudovibrio sp. Tun.PSC04-5.I4]SDQ12967.1 alcohol dehydrogenase [Pseudovibrio sp. Tun.PSC04-5.I4]
MVFALKLPRITLMGEGAVAESIVHLTKFAVKKALVVSDGALVKLGLLGSLEAALKENGIDYVIFDKLTPNPTATQVREGTAVYKAQGCDCFVAIGGGSSIDAAKAIRIMAANPGDITDYSGVEKVQNPGTPFVAIGTTAGTAAEMTSNSVIIDEENQVKMVIIDNTQIPDIAVNDPLLMTGLPADVTAATGMDALTHAVEAYVTPGAHPLTDHSALESIRLIGKWLPVAVKEGKNIEARSNMAYGQFLAGMAFNSAGLGLVHAMAHQPGATHNLPHGVCNAILLPLVCEFNAEQVPQRYKDVAAALGGDVTDLSAEQGAALCLTLIRELSETVGIPKGFAALGIEVDVIDSWAGKAMEDPCLPGNPRIPTREEVKALFAKSL